MKIERIKKISLKSKVIISTIFFVLFIASIVFFIIIPAVNDIKTIRDEINGQRLDLEIKYVKGQSLKSISEKLEKVQPKIDELDRVFIDKNRNLDFITALEEVALNNNIIQKINLLDKKDGGVYELIPVQLFSSGSFNNVMDYLVDLESLSYYINIDSIRITSSNKTLAGSYDGGVNILIFATTYWR